MRRSWFPEVVAPRAGAWIETNSKTNAAVSASRRTPCGCVDRNCRNHSVYSFPKRSHPVRVRGSKPDTLCFPLHMLSRTPCGCVDRNFFILYTSVRMPCRTPCGCVDRNMVARSHGEDSVVAPRAGAWIETPIGQPAFQSPRRRTPCGCVDRNIMWTVGKWPK